MAKIERFEDLQSWQKARQLTNLIYDLTEHPSSVKTFICEVKSRKRLDLSCMTLQKASMQAQTLNSSAFSKCDGALQAKYNQNCILPLTAITSIRMNLLSLIILPLKRSASLMA